MALTPKSKIYQLTPGDREIFKKAANPSDGVGVNWFTSYYFGGRELRPWQWTMHHAKQSHQTIVGGCISGDTILEGQTKPIKDLVGIPITVLSWTGEKFELVKATAPFLKGRKMLYEVTLDNGRSIKVTDDHRFLTSKGYVHLRELVVGDLLAICDFPQLFSLSQKTSAQSYSKTTSSYQCDCCERLRQYDEQLHLEANIFQDVAPSHAYEDECTFHWHHCLSHEDGYPAQKQKDNSREMSTVFSASSYAQSDCENTDDEYYSSLSRHELFLLHQPLGHQYSELLPQSNCCIQPRLIFESHLPAIQQNALSPLAGLYQRTYLSSLYPFEYCINHSLKSQDVRLQNSKFESCTSTPLTSLLSTNSNLCLHDFDEYTLNNSISDTSDVLHFSTIVRIEQVGIDNYYDLHVPIHHNYVAHGIVNHNTGSGKTVGAGLSYATWAATTPRFSFMNLAPTGNFCPLCQ